MMSYHTQFPDYPVDAMPAIPPTFEDVSWHNDMCPCFVSDALGLELWIDYPDREQREHPTHARFEVSTRRYGGAYLQTDDWRAVERWIAFGTLTAAQLNVWYLVTVGYMPQQDDPTTTRDDMVAFCRGYFAEHLNRTGEMP